MPNTQDFAAASRQYDTDAIAKARNIAAAKTVPEIRAAITEAYPTHAKGLADLADEMVWVYANGVMAEVIRELANLAEWEMNRGA
jgi:hypothetical protein